MISTSTEFCKRMFMQGLSQYPSGTIDEDSAPFLEALLLICTFARKAQDLGYGSRGLRT